MNKDAKTGLVTLIVACSLLLLNALRERGVVNFGTEQGLIFTQVHGLREGDTVTVGGVPAGRVSSIDFAPDDLQEILTPVTGGVELVRANVIFDPARKIPKESTYTVLTNMNGIRRVEILGSGDSCPTCAALEGKMFTLDKAPELPHPGCTHDKGCRCGYLADIPE